MVNILLRPKKIERNSNEKSKIDCMKQKNAKWCRKFSKKTKEKNNHNKTQIQVHSQHKFTHTW